MPGRIRDPRIKDAATLKALRDDEASKEMAARTTHASDVTSRTDVVAQGVRSGDYEDWAVEDLRHRAAELGIVGRSTMRKNELIAALRNH